MNAEHIVETANGPVRGTSSPRSEDGRVTVHRGIPYAAAPFGEHRFTTPAPAPAWDGVRDCTQPGPPAPQSASFIGTEPWDAGTSLDCLVLNVWSPTTGIGPEDGTAPVMVWIHGGAYIVGSGSEATYDGTRLAETGMVVVSVNYRLGFEGFGHVPGRPDNRWLLDQVAALRWVRDNIAAFGGNPADVTIAGESAGAGSVVCLMASPEARGLFHRAIAHSVPGDMITVDTAREVARGVADIVGVPLEAGALAGVPAEKLLAATDTILSGTGRTGKGVRTKAFTCYGPVVGCPELPEPPLEAIARGVAADVALLVGHNTDEFTLFTGLGQKVEVEDESALAVTADRLGLGEDAVEVYRAAHPEASLAELYVAMRGDAMFCEYSTRVAEAQAAAGGSAHLFRFAARSRVLEGTLGACHAFDLPFAFGNMDCELARFLCDGPPDAAHLALSDRMTAAWSAFVSGGDPGWGPVRPGTTTARVWDLKDSLSEGGRSPLRALWSGATFAPR
ncbi:carboxylesterase/lipase family protein [Nocardiopsis sp. L17-MgMaSL7]|uniref:carboxylesterase/lipase family protein n=1 Tax=Nocardiopsis sp. L17-MgMaSL7 TaxID=1938893 RepID=UPI000D70AEA3|nr:carboxylesterase family protein [Nocardiopsis sp. L17-MgMaSL7]PWV49200.1 carboxylesterase type B [Nocardiopsis sp. L17-MgMaSL7]